MASTELVPVSVGTEQPRTTTDAGSRPDGVAGSIFDRLQKMVPAEEPKKTGDAPIVEAKTELAKPGTTEQALADAGKTAAAAPATAAAPAKMPPMRAGIKVMNIHDE